MRRYVEFLLSLNLHDDSLFSKLLMIDYVGVLLTIGACTMIMLPLVWVSNGLTTIRVSNSQQGGVSFPWRSAIVLGPLCAGIVAVGLFCVWEAKVAKLPLIPSRSICTA